MSPKHTVLLSLSLILITSLCWAAPIFREAASNLKAHADVAKKRATEIKKLGDQIRALGVDIENLSDRIVAKRQKPKIIELENKIDLFQQRVEELDRLTDILRNLTGKMQHESNRMKKASKGGPRKGPKW